MNKELRRGLRTWIEIDKKAIKHNYNIFRNFIGEDCKMLSVVKSNAYGHNLVEFAHEQEKLGTDFLGVDSVREAIALRKDGIKIPILVLGYTLPEMISEASKKNISVTVSNFESLSALIQTSDPSQMKSQFDGARKIKIHIKVDTGMFRHGFSEADIQKVLEKLKKNKGIVVEGLFTHFSMAKDPNYPTYTKSQVEKFKKCKEAFLKAGYSPICHAAATSGTLILKEGHFDMVRVGIGLYGVWPSEETKMFFENTFTLQPILSWKTIVAEVKKVNKDSRVGYDGAGVAKKDSIIAICPIGYWHGYPRALSNTGYVLINGKRAKILGRVCMDIIIVDVSDVKNIKVGDEVVIIGKSKNLEITADEISILLGGSTYELLTRINPLIKRLYI
jgi:alanine racemase